MASSLLVHGTLCLSQLILVVHSFVVKHALASASSAAPFPALHPPLLFAAARSVISAPVLLLIYFAKTRTYDATTAAAQSSTGLRPYLGAAFCGFIGVFLYPILYVFGLRSTTPTAACVYEALTPVFSLAIECTAMFGTTSAARTRPSWTRALAVLLAVFGSVLMTLQGAWADAGGDVGRASDQVFGRTTGNLYIVGSAAAYAVFLFVQRRTMRSVPGASVMFLTSWGNAFGACFSIAAAASAGALNVTEVAASGLTSDGAAYPEDFWKGVVFAALITSVLGYTLEGLANGWSSPTLVAVYNAVQPFGAVVLSHFWGKGKHAASIVELVAAAAVASGVLLLRSGKMGEEKR